MFAFRSTTAIDFDRSDQGPYFETREFLHNYDIQLTEFGDHRRLLYAHCRIYFILDNIRGAPTKLASKLEEVKKAPKHIYFGLLADLRFKSYFIFLLSIALLSTFSNR